MTVGDLVRKLLDFDQTLPVRISDSDTGCLYDPEPELESDLTLYYIDGSIQEKLDEVVTL